MLVSDFGLKHCLVSAICHVFIAMITREIERERERKWIRESEDREK